MAIKMQPHEPKKIWITKDPIADDWPIYSAKCDIYLCEFNHGWGKLLLENKEKTICPVCKNIVPTVRMPLPGEKNEPKLDNLRTQGS